tara:strand:+ start:28 stop:486 length:459 start_codon:yes stop_codon:yes gene_type:complete
MIKFIQNEKFILGYDIRKDKELFISDTPEHDFIIITNKRIIKRSNANFQWEYKIFPISDLKKITIKKGINSYKLFLSICALLGYFPLSNLLENSVINLILAISSFVFGIIILTNLLFFSNSINLIINTEEKISLTFSNKNNFHKKLLEELSK